jgi:hypothetical protein
LLPLFHATNAHSECVEYKIIEHEDSVEAVCVGKPLTAEEQKAFLEEERKQQLKFAKERSAAQQETDRYLAKQKAEESRRTSDKQPATVNPRLEKARQNTR